MSEDGAEPDWAEPDWSETGRHLAESGRLKHTPDLTKMARRLRALIVGGGAIGPVFGYHLREAGAHVTLFVKPKYAAEAEDGYALHGYGVVGKRPQRHFQPHQVISDHRELREHTFDQVWLCLPSPALRGGFLERLYESCITAPIWVSFQPGAAERQYLTQTAIPSDRLVSGLVNFIAYRAPLPGEDLWPEGVAYFIPPWSMTLFSAEQDLAASAVANTLQRGKGSLVAAVVPDVAVNTLTRRTVLFPFVIALESVQWSLGAMRDNQAVIDLMRTAINELQATLTRHTGQQPGKWGVCQKPWFWKAALFAAPYATAFPLEGYLKYHYTKLRDQSDQIVDDLVELCHHHGVEPRSLEALREQWRSRRGEIESLDADQYDTQTGRRLGAATPMPAAVPDDDPAAASVEFRIDVPEGLGTSDNPEDSQSLVVGLEMSSEFESEDTPPPSASSPVPAAEPPAPESADPCDNEPDDEPEDAPVDEPDDPVREREDTPLPAAILPVPGITDKPVPIEQAEPEQPAALSCPANDDPEAPQAEGEQADDEEE